MLRSINVLHSVHWHSVYWYIARVGDALYSFTRLNTPVLKVRSVYKVRSAYKVKASLLKNLADTIKPTRMSIFACILDRSP